MNFSMKVRVKVSCNICGTRLDVAQAITDEDGLSLVVDPHECRKIHTAQEIAMANLFGKYKIEKADGSWVDPSAMYFVLRIDTDPHARVALRAYARSIRASDPEFANELDEWIESRPTPRASD